MGARRAPAGMTWVVREDAPGALEALPALGLSVTRPGLEEGGTELLRCLDEKGQLQ
jgi:hypothetical protein